MDNEEKQFAPFLFEDIQFQHISKATVWNEACFPVTNHLEELMLHVYHDPLVNIWQSSVKEEFTRFINRAIESNGKVKLPCFKFIFLPREVE